MTPVKTNEFDWQSEVKSYERKIYDLKQLIEISKGLNSTLDYNILIDSILLTCMGQMQLLKAGIFLHKGLDREQFILHRNYKGFELDHNKEYILRTKSPVIRHLEENFGCYTLEELNSVFDDSEPEMKTLLDINPDLLVPLKGKGQLNGIIILAERINQKDFMEAETDYLLNIASLAGIAIQNAFLYEMASTDMMTRLKIHHFFQVALAEERERAAKQKSPLSLVMIDIDHFKKFNDSYGHTTGDAVLINVAAIIKQNVRQIDVAARYGGEEMAIILPNTALEEAIKVCERIRESIEAAKVIKDDQSLSVTVSIGVAQFHEDEDTNNHTFIERADKALYESKRNGRNQVNSIL